MRLPAVGASRATAFADVRSPDHWIDRRADHVADDAAPHSDVAAAVQQRLRDHAVTIVWKRVHYHDDYEAAVRCCVQQPHDDAYVAADYALDDNTDDAAHDAVMPAGYSLEQRQVRQEQRVAADISALFWAGTEPVG